jgi:hypothetical protein
MLLEFLNKIDPHDLNLIYIQEFAEASYKDPENRKNMRFVEKITTHYVYYKFLVRLFAVGVTLLLMSILGFYTAWRLATIIILGILIFPFWLFFFWVVACYPGQYFSTRFRDDPEYSKNPLILALILYSEHFYESTKKRE